MINIHKQPKTEYEVGEHINLNVEASISHVDSLISRFEAYIKLEAKMITYDLLHGTHYRRIRHELAREQRNHSFESRIGLSRV